MTWGAPLNDQAGLNEFRGLDTVDQLARLIYSEARGETKTGKAGVAWTVINRVSKNLSQFGGDSYENVILYPNAFEGMTKPEARQPDTSSVAWQDSVEQALSSSRLPNPIGSCLWFVGNTYFAANVSPNASASVQYWNFGTGNRKIVEKKVIGGHTFFRVEGF